MAFLGFCIRWILINLKKNRICFMSILLHLYMYTLGVYTTVENPERVGIQGLLPHTLKNRNVLFRKEGKIEKEYKLTSVKVECFDRVSFALTIKII